MKTLPSTIFTLISERDFVIGYLTLTEPSETGAAIAKHRVTGYVFLRAVVLLEPFKPVETGLDITSGTVLDGDT